MNNKLFAVFHAAKPTITRMTTKIAPPVVTSIGNPVAAISANAERVSGGTTKTIDGVTLFNVAHPLLGGGTYSNRSATDVAFSVTGLQELTLLFEKMVNERGLLKRTMPEQVWMPPDIQFKAGEILHSAYKPYTGTNEVNVMQGRFTPYVNHYLTNPTQWFMTAAKRGHTLKGYWRTQPQFDSQDDFMTKGASFSVFFRFSAGVTYWHGVCASNGA